VHLNSIRKREQLKLGYLFPSQKSMYGVGPTSRIFSVAATDSDNVSPKGTHKKGKAIAKKMKATNIKSSQ